MKTKKTLFHIDFDSYFVSAHRSRDFTLKNKPVGVARTNSRAICSSISYELKNIGIKVGQPKYMIKRKAPDVVFVEPDFSLYINLSNKIFDYIAEKYSKNMEVYSIDECWVDVTANIKNISPVNLAYQIQQDINVQFDIPVSIGISHTKWLAKMATGLGKPFGITLIDNYDDIRRYIHPLKIDKYFGVGKASSVKLKRIGIETIEDLANKNYYDTELNKIFKNKTGEYIDNANGNGTDELTLEHNEVKNIGKELTFPDIDFDSRENIYPVIHDLCNAISKRAKNRNLIAKTITIIIRSTSKVWNSKQYALETPTNDAIILYNKSIDIFEENWNDEPIRGVGVRLSNLISEFSFYRQLSIFEDDTKDAGTDTVHSFIKEVNAIHKKQILKSGEELLKQKSNKHIQYKFLSEDLLEENEDK